MRWIIPVCGGLLAGCTVQQPAASANQPNSVAANPDPAAPAPAQVPAAAPTGSTTEALENSPLTPPLSNVSAASSSDTSAQGAAALVRSYYALIGQKQYREAHRLWGPSSDSADADFAAQFTPYREYHATVAAPGAIEGAAGSLYVEVPVRTYGVRANGQKFDEPAVVTLRRVNNVDGATPAQLRWHIATIEPAPSPH